MRKWFRGVKSTDITFVVLFSFSAWIVLEYPAKDVSGLDRTKDEGVSLLFETVVEI